MRGRWLREETAGAPVGDGLAKPFLKVLAWGETQSEEW